MILYSKRETKEEEKARDTEGPIPSDILIEPNPVKVNTAFTISATLDDLGTGGSEIASAEYSIDGDTWRSMAPADGALDSPKEKIITKTSVTKPGVYNLLVRGSDEMGNLAPEKSVTLVIYDPDGGFLTGDGWINSPAGAYTDNPSLTGKATFKFMSKYDKDASIPSGQTEFLLAAAGMTFNSTSYDWLVISGARAHCKGSGTINGEGNYAFVMIVVDEKVKGDARPGKFRIKILNKATGRTIYDNGLGGPENMPPITAIAGGSIHVHGKRTRRQSKPE
jgi:hypothetical protein